MTDISESPSLNHMHSFDGGLMHVTRRPWAKLLRTADGRGTRTAVSVLTEDGMHLVMHKIAATSPGANHPPVLLLHGLGANRYTFNFPERSLAEYLSNHGFDCYVPELRGAGDSEHPPSWGLDDYLQRDIPALVSAVLRDSGSEQLHWIGHSMGGILLLAYAVENPDAPLLSGITLGTALNYNHGASDFVGLQKLLPLMRPVPSIPWGTFMHGVSPLIGRVNSPLESFNVCVDNIEPRVVRRLFANAFESIPMRLVRDLSTGLSDRGLCSTDGSIHYAEKARHLSLPLYMLGGAQDRQCPLDAVVGTAHSLNTKTTKLVSLGQGHGQREDYGHFDLVLGQRASTEVWPGIVSWLRTDHLDFRDSAAQSN